MRLYYFTTLEVAKIILETQRIKVSVINELNDPFELLGASIGARAARRIVQYAHKALCERYGLLCLSEEWISPVMWAHYGDRHRGVCLGFEVIDDVAKQVRYEPKRLENLLSKNPKLSDLDIPGLWILMTTKSKEWSYEKEWRVVVKFKHEKVVEDLNGLRLLPIDDDLLELREVIIGHRCKWSVLDAARAIRKVTKSINIKKVRPSFQRFAMVRQRNEPTVRLKSSELKK